MTTIPMQPSHWMTRAIGRVTRLFFVAMFAIQTAGVAFAIRRRQEESETPDPASDEIALFGIFGPLDFVSTAREFRGGSLSCLYGGGILDLRGASLAPVGATLRVQALFGGAQIVAPESWRIETRVIGIGGVGDGRPHVDRPTDAPVLRVEGWAVFGGFGITSEAPIQRA